MRIALTTLGCKVNQNDTAAMASLLTDAGHTIVPFSKRADVYICNTCTVTAQSDKKARQIIARVHRMHPDALLVVCGCLPQRDAQAVLDLDGVDAVLGTTGQRNIGRVLSQLHKGDKRSYVMDLPAKLSFEQGGAASFERTRAYIKIQDGCDRACTYCIIPKTRGPVRSRPLDGVMRACADAAQAGHYEAVLTGIRLAAYGQGSTLTLMDAVEAAAQTPIGRIRLGSLDPDAIDDDCIRRAAACEKLCRHFHLSLQSGSNTVLRRMGRRYTVGDFQRVVSAIRKRMPDASFTTDIMAGFAGETQGEHEQTLRFVQTIGFMRLHVFPYSVREGTAAARMKGHLPKATRQRRARELIAIGDELAHAYAKSQIGKCVEVVWEKASGGAMEGHARSFLRVRAQNIRPKAGQVSDEIITGVSGAVALI